MDSYVHQECVRKARQVEESETAHKSTGVNVARLAYQTFKEALSHASFERRVHDAHLLGARVGVYNHSREFVARFLTALYQVHISDVALFFHTPCPATLRPPPFCVSADKVTTLRESGQVTGVLTMVGGKIVDICMGNPVVDKGSTGKALATKIDECLRAVLEQGPVSSRTMPQVYKEQLTGQAYDGQYFHLGADKEVCRITGTNPKWSLATWDGAHRLELVSSDTRSRCDQFRVLSGSIATVQMKYRYG